MEAIPNPIGQKRWDNRVNCSQECVSNLKIYCVINER